MTMTMTGSGNTVAANDNGGDLLDHIDPRSVCFYTDAAAVAAYLVRGKGHWLASSRCLVTAALMFHCMTAANENRPCTVSEIRDALAQAGQCIHDNTKNESVSVHTAQPPDAPGSINAMT